MGVLTDYTRHLRRRGLAEGTIYKRQNCVSAFRAWTGDDLFAATTGDVEAFLDERGAVGRTRYCWISHLHCFYAWAIDQGLADRDPTAKIDRPKLKRLMPRPVGENDLAMALDLADRTMRAWLVLAAYAGLRVSEIAALDVGDVLVEYGALRILGKGGKERIVPMHPMVEEALRTYGLPRSGPVFRRPGGKPYSAQMVSLEGSRYFDAIGLKVTMHQLRHRFATKVQQSCRDIRVTQELLGHASPSTTAIYTAFSDAAAREAVLAIGTTPGQTRLPFSLPMPPSRLDAQKPPPPANGRAAGAGV